MKYLDLECYLCEVKLFFSKENLSVSYLLDISGTLKQIEHVCENVI